MITREVINFDCLQATDTKIFWSNFKFASDNQHRDDDDDDDDNHYRVGDNAGSSNMGDDTLVMGLVWVSSINLIHGLGWPFPSAFMGNYDDDDDEAGRWLLIQL